MGTDTARLRARLTTSLQSLERALDGWDRDYLPELREQATDARHAIETIESEVYLDERGA